MALDSASLRLYALTMTIPLVAIASLMLAAPGAAADARVEALRVTLAQTFLTQPPAPQVNLLPDIAYQCTELLNSGANGPETSALLTAVEEARAVQRGRVAGTSTAVYEQLILQAARGLGVQPPESAVPVYLTRPTARVMPAYDKRALERLTARLPSDLVANVTARAQRTARVLTAARRAGGDVPGGGTGLRRVAARAADTAVLANPYRDGVPPAAEHPAVIAARIEARIAAARAQSGPAYVPPRAGATPPPAGPPRDPPSLLARLRGYYDSARTNAAAYWNESAVSSLLTDLQDHASRALGIPTNRISLLTPRGILPGLRILRAHNSWGTLFMVYMLRVLGVELNSRGMRVDIEDISRQSGLGRLAGHKSHRRGVDVDINLIGGPAGGGSEANTMLLALIAKSTRLTGSGLVYVFSTNSHMREYRRRMPGLVRAGRVEQVDADAALRALNDEDNHHDHFHVRTAR